MFQQAQRLKKEAFGFKKLEKNSEEIEMLPPLF